MNKAAASAVRIVAGRWKGRRLGVPTGARPTSERAREALFAILHDRIAGARFLDLYAGSGAVGLEALSRGAARAVFVEPAAEALEENLGRLSPAAGEADLLRVTAPQAISALTLREARFDVIFADPPYGVGLAPEVGARLTKVLAVDGIFVLQSDADSSEPEPEHLRLKDRRAYGRNVFHFFEPGGQGF